MDVPSLHCVNAGVEVLETAVFFSNISRLYIVLGRTMT